MEQCELNVGGWLWQILGTICTVATVSEAAEILLLCPTLLSIGNHIAIIRPHRLHAVHKMRPVATDDARSVVCVSVCVLITRM